jgi:hypothetical protein
MENSANAESQVTEIWLMRKVGSPNTQVIRNTGLGKTWRARTRKEGKTLLRAMGWLHGGARVVLP